MTRLLVSVRNAEEAVAALAGGADVIDVKEPSRGALGAADPQMWQSVVHAVRERAPVSIALGELIDFQVEQLTSKFVECLDGVSWAKFGLAGCARVTDWPLRWQAAISALPPHVQSVAVIYADWRTADAPSPETVIGLAAKASVPVVLVDTFDKAAGTLLDHLPLPALATIARQARAHNLKLALAGSLRREVLEQVAELLPDYIAVRGAVCEGARESSVSKQLVERLSSEVHRLAAARTLVATGIA